MANFGETITHVVQNDNFEFVRAIDNLEVGSTITEAWLTIRENSWDTVIIFQKHITTTSTADGHVYDTGTGDLIANIRFNFLPAETILMSPFFEYAYSLRVLTSSGNYYTPEIGLISCHIDITN